MGQERRAVEAVGGELVVGQAAAEDHLIELCRDADGVLVTPAPITRRVVAAMERCRIIVRYGVGLDCVDLPRPPNVAARSDPQSRILANGQRRFDARDSATKAIETIQERAKSFHEKAG